MAPKVKRSPWYCDEAGCGEYDNPRDDENYEDPYNDTDIWKFDDCLMIAWKLPDYCQFEIQPLTFSWIYLTFDFEHSLCLQKNGTKVHFTNIHIIL